MINKVYQLIGILSVVFLIVVILYRDEILMESLLWIVSVLFLLLVVSIHGMIAHTLKPAQKGNLIFYPILMGILFGIIAAVYFFFIMPLIMNAA